VYPGGTLFVVSDMRGLPSGATLLSLLWVVGTGGPASATEVGGGRNFGLGLGVGTATSLVGKFFLASDTALDFGVSFWRHRSGCWQDRRGVLVCDGYADSYRYGSFGLHADYLWQATLLRRTAKLDWHLGAGARYWHWDYDDYYYQYYRDSHSALAARMPAGLDLTFIRPSFLELYVEAAPTLFIAPFVDLDMEAFLGARLYF
jgi:hypothetical protein